MRLITLVIGFGFFAISCTVSPPTSRQVVDQPTKAIGLEVTYREGSPEYSHPAAITQAQLEKFLRHIEVHPSSLLSRILGGASTNIQEAFSQEQVEFFTSELSKAFSQATSLETITLYWAIPRKNGIWEITSGGIYLHNNQLHLVLPNYRHTISGNAPPQILKNQPLTPLDEPLHSLKASSPVEQLSYNIATELLSPPTPHFVVSLQALSHARTPYDDRPGLASSPRGSSGPSIKDRLKNLEDLLEEGLLTEKEYQQKRQEILEQL